MAKSDRTTPGAGGKTLLVLETAVRHRRFSDIVAESHLPKSTVHRILAALVEEGFLQGHADQGFEPGPRLTTLSGRVMASMDVSSLARPIIETLVTSTDCTIHLAAVSGDHMVYVIREDPSTPYRMRSRVGLPVPLHATAVGKAYLAFQSTQTVAAYAARTGLPPRTEATITQLDDLYEELEQINKQNYALDLGENEPGTVCIAAPVRDHTGQISHGLSASSISLAYPERSIETIAPSLVHAASELTQRLGGP